jgi:hypothetical protein
LIWGFSIILSPINHKLQQRQAFIDSKDSDDEERRSGWATKNKIDDEDNH